MTWRSSVRRGRRPRSSRSTSSRAPQELSIPLDKKAVKVTRSRDRIYIDVEYTIPVEFPGYTYQWHFRHKLDRPIFII